MSAPSEAIGRVLNAAYAVARGRPIPTSDEAGPAAILTGLRRQFGVHEGARRAGIDRRTFQRATNRGADARPYKPTAGTLDKLRQAYRELVRPELVRQETARRKAARAGVRGQLLRTDGPLTVSGVFCVSNDCRHRTLKFAGVFTTQTRAAIVNAYENNDLDEAAHQFNVGLNRDYLGNSGAIDMYCDDIDRMVWR